jgi:hypothetical protein
LEPAVFVRCEAVGVAARRAGRGTASGVRDRFDAAARAEYCSCGRPFDPDFTLLDRFEVAARPPAFAARVFFGGMRPQYQAE